MVSRAIVAPQPDTDLLESWAQQRIFLESKEGDVYRDDLYEHRKVLRGQMTNNVWSISSPGAEKPPGEPHDCAKN
jgi:hypothetical protein